MLSLSRACDLRECIADERTHSVSLHEVFAGAAIDISRTVAGVDHRAYCRFYFFGLLLQAGASVSPVISRAPRSRVKKAQIHSRITIRRLRKPTSRMR